MLRWIVNIVVELKLNHGDVTNRPILDNSQSGRYHKIHDPT
jgi:hypothetical protein